MARAVIPFVVNSPVNGSAVAGATVTVTKASDATAATIYTSRTGVVTLGTNVITTDAQGRCRSGAGEELFLEQGTYLCAISGTNLTGETKTLDVVSGDAVDETTPPGVCLPFPGAQAPAGWLLADGSELTRTQYPKLYKAITIQTTGNTTNTSQTISNLATTVGMAIGQKIEGANIPAGTTITGIPTSTSITISAAATGTTTNGAITVFIHGTAGTSTFTLPDMRQKMPLGKATSGTGAVLGGTGGELTHILTTAEMPSHTHAISSNTTGVSIQNHVAGITLNSNTTGMSVNNGSHSHTLGGGGGKLAVFDNGGVSWIQPGLSGTGAFYIPATTGYHNELGMATDSAASSSSLSDPGHSHTVNDAGHSHSVTDAGHSHTATSAGSDQAHNNMPPFLTLNFIIRHGNQ